MRAIWTFAWLTTVAIVHNELQHEAPVFHRNPIGAMAMASSNLGVCGRRHEIQANILDRKAQRYPRFSISLP